MTIHKLFIPSAAFIALSFSTIGYSQSDKAKEQLEQSIAELAAIRKDISSEREPLASELRSKENEVIELRRTRERMQRLIDNQTLDLGSLQGQTKAYEDESTYVINLLSDYYNRANASLGVAEVSIYQPKFLEILNKADNAETPAFDRLGIQIPGLVTALDRTESIIGGVRHAGEAVLPNGQIQKGTFAEIGPVTYFSTESGSHAGLILRGASETPALIEFDPAAVPQIAKFVESGEGILSIDPTLGRALALATAEESLIEHFNKGGLWMYPIAFFAIFATAIAAMKIVQMVGTKSLPEASLNKIIDLVEQDKVPDAIHLAKSIPGPGAEMIAKGLQNIRYSKELMEEFLFETLLEEKPRLERGISFIMLSASVAPLLGLLGTVTGMIETFKLLTLFGTGDAKSLSSGISQALITTEFGLVAAIPSLILAAVVGRMAASKLGYLEKLIVLFSNGVAAAKEKVEANAA